MRIVKKLVDSFFQKNNWTPLEAVQHMQSCRPHILLGPKQKYAIQTYYENIQDILNQKAVEQTNRNSSGSR